MTILNNPNRLLEQYNARLLTVKRERIDQERKLENLRAENSGLKGAFCSKENIISVNKGHVQMVGLAEIERWRRGAEGRVHSMINDVNKMDHWLLDMCLTNNTLLNKMLQVAQRRENIA